MTPFVAPVTFFEADGVHLNSDAGSSFIFYLISGSYQLFPPDTNVSSGSLPSGDMITSSLASLSRSVTDLRSDIKRRRMQDNLLFARIKEDRDHELNRSKEDRCTISGLHISQAPPSDPKERKEFFKGLFSNLVAEACPETEGRPLVVINVLVNMRSGRGPPFFEIKLDSVVSSQKFRSAAAKLSKDGIGSFNGIFISNTVNMSTRIRIDIMKLIAKRLTTPTESCYVQGFSSRPTLHYRVKDLISEGSVLPETPPAAVGTGRSYTFTESVERWGHLLSPFSLEPIRRKASQAFRDCLEQYFVVLSDRSDAPGEDCMFSRLTSRPQAPSRTSYSRGPRGARFPRSGPSRGRSSRLNPWQKYDHTGPVQASTSASVAASPSLPPDQNPLKRQWASEVD